MYLIFLSVTKNNLLFIGMKKFRLGKTIGEGSYGKVKIAKHVDTNQYVAIKCINKLTLSTHDKSRINEQIAILKQLHHPNISELFEVIEDEEGLYMVMEYIEGGDLLEQMKNNVEFSEGEIEKMILAMTNALMYLHGKGIAHRDIKLANVLLDLEKNIKIIDFGLSREYVKGAQLYTSCGSPCFAAPEVIREELYYPETADVWSVGVVFYCLLMGQLPFYHHNLKVLFKKVQLGEYKQPTNVSSSAKTLLNSMLEVEPSKRISLKQIQCHRFFKLSRQSVKKKLNRQSSFDQLEKKKIILQIIMSSKNCSQLKAKQILNQKKFDHFSTKICLLKKMSLLALTEYQKLTFSTNTDSQKTIKSPLKNSPSLIEGIDRKRTKKSLFHSPQKSHLTNQNSQLKSQTTEIKRFQRNKHLEKNQRLIKSVSSERKMTKLVENLEQKYIKSTTLLNFEEFNRDKFFEKLRKQNKSFAMKDDIKLLGSARFSMVQKIYWETSNENCPAFKGPYCISHTVKATYQDIIKVMNKLVNMKIDSCGKWKFTWGFQNVEVLVYSVYGFNNLQLIRTEPFIPNCTQSIVSLIFEEIHKN